MPSSAKAVTIRLAKSALEFESALRLIRQTRSHWGLPGPAGDDLWLLKHHALPSTSTIVALRGDQVIGALCLFGESPFRLPVESHLDLQSLRQSVEGRLAEISLPGLHPDYSDRPDLLFALFQFVACFGTTNCNYDGFVTEAPLGWSKEHADVLRFQRLLEPLHDRQLLFLDARAVSLDFRASIDAGFTVDYVFPEKRFFLVAHQCMRASVLNRLFNERTNLFTSLNDQDLRVLKNFYDWGEYATLLPDRLLDLPEKRTPRFPRFPMNCQGYLVTEKGAQEHVHLLDVSREGLKVRTSHRPDLRVSHVFTLFVGVKSKTEIIAQAVWVDEKSGIVGFEIRSSDQGWAQLIDYLEKDYLRIA